MGEQQYIITLSLIAVTWLGIFLFCITSIGKYYIQQVLLSDIMESSSSKSIVTEQVSTSSWDSNMSTNRFRDYPSQYSMPTSVQLHYSFFYDPDTADNKEKAFDFHSVTWIEEYLSVKNLIQQNRPLYLYCIYYH